MKIICTDRQTDRQTDRWTDGWMDRWTDSRQIHGQCVKHAWHILTLISVFDEGDEDSVFALPSLSQLLDLNALWEKLSQCLIELADSTDNHAVLVLQPTVEAFFLVHGSEKGQTSQQPVQERIPPERSLSHHRLVINTEQNMA